MSNTFALLATVTASTKRNPEPVAGIVGAPVTNIASLSCTPLDPLEPEVRQLVPSLASLGELLQTYVQGSVDIRDGDILVVATHEYAIRAVADWDWRPDSSTFRVLVLEDLK